MTAEAPYSVTLNVSAPPGPDYVLEVAQAFAECVRVMNHATRHHAALEYPHEGDQFLRYLESPYPACPSSWTRSPPGMSGKPQPANSQSPAGTGKASRVWPWSRCG